MKILFYLPAVTPWWFETIITPMLRSLYSDAELHVMVAPLWHNTGLEMAQVEPLADLPGIHWHIVEADDPARFRMDGANVEGLLDLVRSINPDITLARSADRDTPALFPGVVRHIMEPGAEPFHTPHRWFVLEEQPFHHGVIPADIAERADRAAAWLAPYWDAIEAEYAERSTAALREMLGLPAGRPVLAIPLQYEHEENFYGVGSPFQHGPEFVRTLLDQLDERIVLAITDHPLNAKYLMRSGLDRLAAEFPDRVRLYPPREDRLSPTNILIRAADAVLLDRSKCASLAIFFGTPIVHVGDSMMADWLKATPLSALNADMLINCALPAPDKIAARRWFGWHYGMRLTDFREVTLATLQDRVFDRTDDAETERILTHIAPWCDAAVATARRAVAEACERWSGSQIAA